MGIVEGYRDARWLRGLPGPCLPWLLRLPCRPYALSGGPPTLALTKACKLPGKSCHLPDLKFGYKFVFDATNCSPYDIYICDVQFTATGTGVDPLTWYHPNDPCIKISAPVAPATCATAPIIVLANSSSSANLDFTTTMTVTWSHSCPCSDDHDVHPPVVKTVSVLETAPDCLTCEGTT